MDRIYIIRLDEGLGGGKSEKEGSRVQGLINKKEDNEIFTNEMKRWRKTFLLRETNNCFWKPVSDKLDRI